MSNFLNSESKLEETISMPIDICSPPYKNFGVKPSPDSQEAPSTPGKFVK